MVSPKKLPTLRLWQSRVASRWITLWKHIAGQPFPGARRHAPAQSSHDAAGRCAAATCLSVGLQRARGPGCGAEVHRGRAACNAARPAPRTGAAEHGGLGVPSRAGSKAANLWRRVGGATMLRHLPAVGGGDVGGLLRRRVVEPLPLIAHAVGAAQLGDDPLRLVPAVYEQVRVGLPVDHGAHVGRQSAGHVDAVHHVAAGPTDLEASAVPGLRRAARAAAEAQLLLAVSPRRGRLLLVARVAPPQGLHDLHDLGHVGGVLQALRAADGAARHAAAALRPQEAVPAEGVPATTSKDGLAELLVAHRALPLA
mmetsp:Transcript_8517/g.26495  ORF Transcript_8517/g.26495 Transcript_8517/m.26495 type:complete len:311 (-) Transcript_8517:182-1114(-)